MCSAGTMVLPPFGIGSLFSRVLIDSSLYHLGFGQLIVLSNNSFIMVLPFIEL